MLRDPCCSSNTSTPAPIKLRGPGSSSRYSASREQQIAAATGSRSSCARARSSSLFPLPRWRPPFARLEQRAALDTDRSAPRTGARAGSLTPSAWQLGCGKRVWFSIVSGIETPWSHPASRHAPTPPAPRPRRPRAQRAATFSLRQRLPPSRAAGAPGRGSTRPCAGSVRRRAPRRLWLLTAQAFTAC